MPKDFTEIEREIDSLDRAKDKIELCFNYYEEYSWHQKETAASLFEKAQSISLESDYKAGLVRVVHTMANTKRDNGQCREALNYYKEARVMALELSGEDSYLLARVIIDEGACRAILSDYTRAAKEYKEALNLTEKFGDIEGQALVYSNLSSLNGILKNYDASIYYSERSIENLKKVKNYRSCIISYNNIATTFSELGRYDDALEQINLALEMIESSGCRSLRALIYLTRGEILLAMGLIDEALDSQHKALKSYPGERESWEKLIIYFNLGTIYLEKGDGIRGLKYLKSALKMCQKSSYTSYLKSIHEKLYLYYEEKGRFKRALYHYKEFFEQEKKSFDLEMDNNIKNIEAESLRHSNERIKIISRIGQRITSTLDMQAVLESVYESVNSLMDAAIFAVVGYDGESGRISYELSIENGKRLPPLYFSVEQKNSFTALAIKEKRDIIINDYESEYKLYFDDEAYKYKVSGLNDKKGAESMIYIPLFIEERVTGLITVQSFSKSAYSLTEFESLKVLASYVAIALNNARQATLIREQNRQLKKLAVTDSLTGTYNRREFERRLTSIWKISTVADKSFSIILLDADHFKDINDNFGHLAGDECLKRLASILKNSVESEGDCIARYGGEEFIILVNASLERALQLAEEIRSRVEYSEINFQGETLSLTVSIGVSSSLIKDIEYERGAEMLISRADEALYKAKESGRNQVCSLL